VRNPLGSGIAVVQDPALEAEAERMALRAASTVPPIQAKQVACERVALPSSRALTVASNGAIPPPVGAESSSVQRGSETLFAGGPGVLSRDTRRVAGSAPPSSKGNHPPTGTSLLRSFQIVQRSPKTLSILSSLAKPQTFTSPAAAEQLEVANELDKIADELAKDARLKLNEKLALQGGVFGVGAVVLPNPVPTDDVLIARATLSEIPGPSVPSFYAGIKGKNQSVCDKVARVVMQTMVKAKQTEYIRELRNEHGRWQFLAEVHYYRSRDQVDNSKFHKDTYGQTLFVNLNYINEAPIAGPEYIENAPVVRDHQEKIEKSLPDEFLIDLDVLRRGQKPKEVEYTTIPTHGVVAFVDEWIHHMTPTVGLRTISKGSIKYHLKNDQSFIDAERAIDRRSTRGATNKSRNPWKRLVIALRDNTTSSMNRADWSALGLEDREWDRLLWLDENKQPGYYHVSIPKSPVTEIEGPRLRRAMSQTAIERPTQLPPKPVKGVRRRFFRTWVRAIKIR
jgi:hypothetical protein